jgi:hypothetical protein
VARGAVRRVGARCDARHNTRDAAMSDDEHDVETFESADAGASHTVPMQAGSVRKGGFMVRRRRATEDATRCAIARRRGGRRARRSARASDARQSDGKEMRARDRGRRGRGARAVGRGRRLRDFATWGLSRGNPVWTRAGRRERERDGRRLTMRRARC